jgi:ribosomal protein S18 acetylase RimI-like enzyme
MVFFRIHNREIKPEERSEPIPTERYAALSDSNLRVWAALAEGRFVGWISAVFIPKIGHPAYGGRGHLYIDELWTHPEHRRQGIAAALLARAEIAAKEMNAAGLRLYVGADNLGAFALYTHFGFRDRGGDAHFMDKEFRAR